jgi:hypothetical protein
MALILYHTIQEMNVIMGTVIFLMIGIACCLPYLSESKAAEHKRGV